jgi:hypothetical protein
MMAIARTQDIKISAVVARSDPTLHRLIESGLYGGELTQAAIPNNYFMDEKGEVIKSLRGKYPHLTFAHVSDLNLEQSCDAVVDTAPLATNGLQQQYTCFAGPIICQDGVSPWGHLVAPPVLSTSVRENRWRQGGCILSGVTPVFAALRGLIKRLRLTIVMQDDSRGDYFITERTNSFRLVHLPRIEAELQELFPEIGITLENLLQIPGMLHYAVLPVMECEKGVSAGDIIERLRQVPRVRVVPAGIISTHDLNLTRSTDSAIPPIAVFAESVQAHDMAGATVVKLALGLHYPMLAVLPNVDTVRILLDRVDPLEAMRQTDLDMGYQSE